MIFILMGKGFEEAEALIPCDFLRRAGLEVKLVSLYDEKTVSGGHGIKVECDASINSTDSLPDAIVLPGGLGGVNEISACPKALELVKSCYAENKTVAAICAAPTILGKLGILKDKKATCYPDMKNELICGKWVDSDVVIDGKIVTSKAAGTASEFAFALISHLLNEESAKKVSASVYFPR
jgi:4-methyl-5(b-hydroxyethyl)-thiazole monophosphate biosynthesis